MFKRSVVVGLCLVLAGCGSIKKQWDEFTPDRDASYLDAEIGPELTTPAPIAANKALLSDAYPIPKGSLPPKDAKPVDIFPPDLKKEPSDDDTDDADAS